jgi:uncharacterized protein (TIGR04255 family)
MQLPATITPCPITEAIIEVRFEPAVERDAVFGILYQQLKKTYTSSPEKTFALQLPEPIRDMDPGLKYQPYYKFKKNDIVLQIGPNVLSVSAIREYPGWDVLRKEFHNAFSILTEAEVVKEYSRFALRYINQMEGDATSNMQWAIQIGDIDVTKLPFNITAVISAGIVESTLRYHNDLKDANDKPLTVIDIDSVLRGPLSDFPENINKYLETVHSSEKEIFFTSLKPEYLQSLSPEYV